MKPIEHCNVKPCWSYTLNADAEAHSPIVDVHKRELATTGNYDCVILGCYLSVKSVITWEPRGISSTTHGAPTGPHIEKVCLNSIIVPHYLRKLVSPIFILQHL